MPTLSMPTFMPVDDQKAQELNGALGQTMFKSVPDFVQFYNSGLINKKHPEVVKYAGAITSLFRNIREKNGRLHFIPQEEVFIDEILSELDVWSALVKVKAGVRDSLEDGAITPETPIFFSTDRLGVALTMDEEGNPQAVSEKLLSRQGDVVALYRKFSSVQDEGAEEEGRYPFTVNDLTSVDTSFVSDLRRIIPA